MRYMNAGSDGTPAEDDTVTKTREPERSTSDMVTKGKSQGGRTA